MKKLISGLLVLAFVLGLAASSIALVPARKMAYPRHLLSAGPAHIGCIAHPELINKDIDADRLQQIHHMLPYIAPASLRLKAGK